VNVAFLPGVLREKVCIGSQVDECGGHLHSSPRICASLRVVEPELQLCLARIRALPFLAAGLDCVLCGWYRTANMAKQEGVRRVVMTGKLIVLIGIALGVLSVLTVYASRNMFLYPGLFYGLSIALRVAALGGLVWAAGWIADGFTRPDP
jgi:hypothetical protein